MRVIWSMIKKEIILWIRNRGVFAIGFISPLLILLLTRIMFGMSTSFPLALVIEDQGEYGQEMADIIRNDSLWKVVSSDPQESQTLYDSGRIFLVVTIPADFSEKIEAGQEADLQYTLNNSFSDVTKNARLRLDNTMNTFNSQILKIPMKQVIFKGILPEDIPRVSYLAVGTIVYALIFGGIINGGFVVSREWEEETVKEILLCHAGSITLILGKMLSALMMTLANAFFIYLISALLLGLQFQGNILFCLGFICLIGISQVALGILIGTLAKRFVLLVPPAGILGVGGFFLCGGFSHFLQLPQVSRQVAKFIPLTYAFDAVQKTFHSYLYRGLSVDVSILTLVTLIFLSCSVLALQRQLKPM